MSQTCRHIWNAAMGVGPNRAANEAAKVTQIVTAITLVSKREPAVGQASVKRRLFTIRRIDQYIVVVLAILEEFFQLQIFEGWR